MFKYDSLVKRFKGIYTNEVLGYHEEQADYVEPKIGLKASAKKTVVDSQITINTPNNYRPDR